jgi:hypothetical protein
MDGVGRMETGWGCGYHCFGGEEALLGEAEFDVADTGAEGFNTNPSGGQDDGGGGGAVLGPAPYVRATGAFLREFIVSVSAKKPVNGGVGGKGKGKVSPVEEQEEEQLEIAREIKKSIFNGLTKPRIEFSLSF